MPYSYPPGFPPQDAGYAPGAVGYGMMASPLGGGQTYGQQQLTVQAGGLAAGMSGLNFATSTLPGMLGTGAMVAGVAGNFLEIGGRNAFTRGLGTMMNYMDPLSGPLTLGMQGAFGAGRGLFGTGLFAGGGYGVGANLAGALGYGAMGRGIMGGIGAAVGGIGAAAVPMAVAYGGYKAGQWALNNVYQGGMDMVQGQGLANQLGPSIAPGQNMAGQGVGMGNMMHDLSRMMGTSTDDISRFAKELNAQKLFQTTRDAQEFRSKFTEAMKAVKEIARITQSTIDDAVKMFGDLRQQGFYNTADIKSQAAVTQAREATSGLSYNTLSQVGGFGSQVSRSFGMRGRFGSDLAQRNVAGVALGMRMGTMSEEEVMEMGGAEAVGMNMAQKQMQFLSTSRGRAIIAAMMGAGGAPDPHRMQNFLGGNMTMEDIVTSAAGRGLGVLRQAGMRESKEAMMPYAGMAMVQMAAAQQQMLYGGTSRNGIIGMLGTMGVGRQESQILLAQTMGMPEQMRQERIAQENALTRANYDSESTRLSFGRVLRNYTGRTEDSLRRTGSNFVSAASGSYRRAFDAIGLGDPVEYSQSDFIRRRAHSRGEMGPISGAFNRSLSTEQMEEAYGAYSTSKSDLVHQYGSNALYQKAVERGDIIEIESGRLASGRAIRRSTVNDIDRMRNEAAKQAGFDDVTRSRLAMQSRDESMYGKIQEGRRDIISRMSGGGVGGALVGNWYTGGGGAMPSMFRGMIDAANMMGLGGGIADSFNNFDMESETFIRAKEAGILSKTATFEDFMSGKLTNWRTGKRIDAQERMRIQEGIRKEVVGGGGLTDLARQGGTGFASIRDVKAARDQAKSALGDLLNLGIVNQRGIFGKTWGAGAKVKDLQEAIHNKGDVQGKFVQFLSAMSKSKDSATSRDEAVRLYDEMVKSLGGRDAPAAQALAELYTNLKDNPELAKQVGEMADSGSWGKALDTAVLAEDLQRAAEGDLKSTDALVNELSQKDSVLGKNLSGSTINKVRAYNDSLKNKGDIFGRRKDLIADIMAGGISADEERVLAAIGGGEGLRYGKALQEVINLGATKGTTKTSKLRDFLERHYHLKFSDDEVKRLQAATSDTERTAIAMGIMKEKGYDTDTLTSAEGKKGIEGSETSYVDANKEFVLAVDAFVSKLAKAGILKDVEGIDAPALTGDSTAP